MGATSSLCYTASALPPLPFSGDSICRRKVLGGSRRVITKTSASKRDAHGRRNFDGQLVDESMIVLRKRIHEMGMLEKNYEPPEYWMEWEKQYKKAEYDSDVCEAVGYLQSKLMETRPSLALGMGALLLLSVSTSMAALVFHVMALIKGLYL